MRKPKRSGQLGITKVRSDRERVAEMRENQKFHRGAAQTIVAAACRISRRGDGLPSGRKVYLSDLAGEVGIPMKRLAPTLVAYSNLGWIKLARADLRGAMDARKIADSSIDLNDGQATFDFIEIDPNKDC